jgi:hypothetical protein
MATNEFIPVVFNDGEPLDPTKLNNLVKNINNVYQSAALSLSNSTNSDGTQVLQTPIIFTYRHVFQDVTAGAPAQKHSFNFNNRFTNDELNANKVYVTTGVTNAVGDKDNINIAISNVKSGAPTIWCSMVGDKTRNVSVDIIAICMKDII